MKGTSKIKAPPPVAESRENAKRDLDDLGSLKLVREDERQPRGQRFPSLTPLIALTIGIALLLAGVFWITSITGTSITGISDEIQFTGVEAYYRNNREAGKLFVLRGRVVIPPGLSAKKRIRVHASVLNDAKGIVAEQTTRAGLMVPDEVLGSRNREDIEEELSRGGDPTWSAAGPTPDGTIPFMVIFFNVTDTVASYKLSARSEE